MFYYHWVDQLKYSINIGCSLEPYRERIGIFVKTVKGKKKADEGPIRKQKSYTNTSKGMLLLLLWYSINLFLAPLVISLFEVSNPSAIHPAGRAPPLPGPSFRSVPGFHPSGRAQPVSSHPFRTEQLKVAHKIPYLLSSKLTNRAAHAIY